MRLEIEHHDHDGPVLDVRDHLCRVRGSGEVLEKEEDQRDSETYESHHHGVVEKE